MTSSEGAAADVVIVGAGQAGAHVAMFLRQQKYAGSVMLIGEEPVLPYERPAMSKEYLAGEKTFDKLVLRPDSFWAERKIDVRCGERVDVVDADRREVRTKSGKTIGWKSKLVWAAGGRPKKIAVSGHDLIGVHYVRDRADVDRMRVELDSGIEKVVIIGGGYIGLEVAAVLNSKHGKKVTVLEAQDRVLARVAAEPLSRFFEEEHRAKGVEIRLGAMVTSLEGSAHGKVTGVKLSTGEVLEASLVVVGIGIDAVVEPLVQAGAEGENGVYVDLRGQTSLADVYAVGDCTLHENVYANGKRVRLESIQNANDQAMIIAKDIAGTLKESERYESVPWFWSNQFDLRLQTVGYFIDHDEVLLRGDPKTRSFSVVYLRAGKVIALDCINQTKDYMQGKPLIVSGRLVDREKLQRADVPLKEL
jgi:3-phenylpropionate/trans-cinnamate dioxygenase ferredoxin reductase component